ncbi:hypothetical protein ONZ51_g1354 [Trametes cubensis]|uniref:Yeast cell wall synthesis Kre9/Knh1-like N-terminal domain-containing protein n=1 Tax=Trametes cubensis TaxID=1111947 RepID=A0AAD7XHT3_9APHY|nr:hypothetical protein ONZ51_g1354 [Trametes cubensis]
MFAGQGLVAAAAAQAAPSGGVTPTAPGPNDVFNEGANCTFSWTPDPSGVWKQTDVELMTGDNFNMVFLTTVASFDGTDASLTSFSYPCPEVEPNSAIYFYQFSSPAALGSLMWTTRFAIADAQGKVTPPPNSTQPNGQAIPWGTGKLADPSKAVPEPSYLVSGGSSSANSTTTTTTSSGNADSTTSSGASGTTTATNVTVTATATATSSAPDDTAASSPGGDSTPVVTVTQTQTSSGSSTPTSGTSGSGNGGNGSGSGTNDANGAHAVHASWSQAAVALGLTAAVFAVAL